MRRQVEQSCEQPTWNSSQLPTSFSYGEDDMNYRVRVLGLPISLCGIKTNLLRSALRRLIEAVSESTHDAKNADLARRREHHVQQHLAFDVNLPGFRCV